MIKQGSVLTIVPGFDIEAYWRRKERDGTYVYSDHRPLECDTLIVMQKIADGYLLERGSHVYPIGESVSLWTCLSAGKEVWITNLDHLEGMAFHVVDDT